MKTVLSSIIFVVFCGHFYWVQTTAFKKKKKFIFTMSFNTVTKVSKKLCYCHGYFLLVFLHHHTDLSAAFFRNVLTFSLTQSFSTFNHRVKVTVVWALSRCRAKGLEFAFLWRLFLNYCCSQIPAQVCRREKEKYRRLKLTVVNVDLFIFSSWLICDFSAVK